MNKIERVRQMSARELTLLGMQDIAYVKRAVVNDVPGYSVHAADGTQIAAFVDRDVAFATVRQHDLEPLSVH
ncbi:MAG TPA: DUF1150 family protein [Stellaceae bacterium]|nr:DUF1150 family protein [Stellaceae bacterium]